MNSHLKKTRLASSKEALAAYHRVEARLLTVPADLVGRVTTDVTRAAAVALGAVGRLETLKSDFAALNDGGEAVSALESLSDVALAAFFCQLECVPDSDKIGLLEVSAEARRLREDLLQVAEGLARFDALPAADVQQIKEGEGYLDAARDLIDLGAALAGDVAKGGFATLAIE